MVKRSVLVVDDEPQIRELFTEMLGRAGYAVRTAESGERALELMREDPAWVLFLDLNLGGMNGLELARAVRSQWPMAITYAVTGYSSLFELSDCRAAGFDDYFDKPVPTKTLQQAAARAFDKLDRWRTR